MDDGNAIDAPDDPIDALERGLSAYLAVDAVRDLLDAVDVEALLSDAPIEEAVDYESGVRVVGRLVGRVAVRDVLARSPAGPLVEQVGGQAAGAKAGEAAADLLIEQYDPEGLLAALEAQFDSNLWVENVAGGAESIEDGVDIEIESADDQTDDGSNDH
ncbi:hypothetical protein G9464_01345 [Halostella sp. JP-L12]|uniref:hypothetical protein n=1 Tax=Halostella TaxID=1843185 RepID=UPI000EF7A4A3|nr:MULTISPECIES: hypothetical protein [Halostella]NHN46245.1 hypothetical protein [Halostella sp. JP-L12]